MIRYNTDCPYCHDVFDQYCNLFQGYKHCDKTECKVLDLLKENEQLKQQNEKMKCCENCDGWDYISTGERDCIETCCSNRSNWRLRDRS